MQQQPWVIVDVETTGGSPINDRVIEIGIIRVENGKIVKQFESLVNPEQPIPWLITRITGLSDTDVWQAPCFGELRDQLAELLSEAIFIAHNARFDYEFLFHELRRCSGDWESARLCTVQLARQLLPGLASYNLDSVMVALGIGADRRHRALDDAIVVWEMLQRLHSCVSATRWQQTIARTIKGNY